MKLAILAGVLTSVAGVAWAQDNTAPEAQQPAATAEQPTNDMPQRKGRFQRFDANNDGSVTQDEFVTAERLREADANSDGTLSAEELGAMVQKRELERKVERLTRRLDVNGDGQVTVAEVEKHKADRFAFMDRNDDGKLEGRELRRGKHGGKHWGGHGDRQGRNRDRDGRDGRGGGDMDL